jgi:hypothetical protein
MSGQLKKISVQFGHYDPKDRFIEEAEVDFRCVFRNSEIFFS